MPIVRIIDENGWCDYAKGEEVSVSDNRAWAMMEGGIGQVINIEGKVLPFKKPKAESKPKEPTAADRNAQIL